MKDGQFGTLRWDEDIWEGSATFERFREWGAALDEKDPPDTRPAEPADRAPTRRQLEARDQLAGIASQLGGEEGALLGSLIANFASNLQAPAPAPAAEEEDEEEDEDTKRLRQGVCTLMIETADDRRTKPTKAQRAAWQAIVSRGDALWDELLEKSFDIYQRQLPVRRKWWKAVYGDYLLDRRLPEVKTLEQFARLVRPYLFRIKSPPDKTTPPEISLHLMATWEVDGLGVILRDGQVAEFGQVVDVVHPSQRNREAIEHPVFGLLKRIPSDDAMEFINEWEKPIEPGESGFKNARRIATRPWQGYVRFDPLLDFAMVADGRAQYAHDRANADRPESRMRWEFADGRFELRVYAPAGEAPSDAQAKAWAAFKANEKRYAGEMVETIFRQYQETCAVRRNNWKDRYIDDVVPVLEDKSGLRELIQLIEIHVHPADDQGRVTIAFAFVAAYDYDGFSTLWRDGRFEEWGVWKDAAFRGFR